LDRRCSDSGHCALSSPRISFCLKAVGRQPLQGHVRDVFPSIVDGE
jgi:hypothetical protein